MKTNIFSSHSSIQVLSLILCCAFLSCDKDPVATCRQIPTCEYFTCKVNGVRWEPQCHSEPLFGCTPWDVQYYRYIPALDMYIDNELQKQRISIFVRNKKLILGNNELFTENFLETSFSDGKFTSNCKIFILDSLAFQTLNITKIDTINKYLSGGFSFSCKNNCGDIVNITDGEFNLPYRF